MNPWERLADKSLSGGAPTREEALAVLRAPDEETLDLLAAAGRVRRRFHGNRVRLHVLQNAKSGWCPEDCGFCSQSSRAETPIDRYPLMKSEDLVAAARRARAAGAWKYCLVTATRGPSERDLDVICEAVRQIKKEIPVKVCTSLGLLQPGQAERLAAAGVDRFNHNLETSARHFPSICTTHTWEDRLATLRAAKAAGMSACSGGIIGMGETHDDVVDLAFAVRDAEADSIPVNFLNPRPGTALGGPVASAPGAVGTDLQVGPPSTSISGGCPLTPLFCLRVLAMFRLVNPTRDIRVAAGRELNLRSLAPLALTVCNSIFTNGYLTTPGSPAAQDRQMIRDAGYEIEQVEVEVACDADASW